MKKLLIAVTALAAVLYILTGCADKGLNEAEPIAGVDTYKASEKPLSPPPPPQTEENALMPKAAYSGYAHMRSLNTDTGIAEFEYFEMLTGRDAVDYLINCEGYCSLVAQSEVEEFPVGGFLEKRGDSARIAIDITDAQIKLLYNFDASIAYDTAQPSDFEDLKSLYEQDKSYVLFKHFYYITVDEDTGKVELLEQVFWQRD